MAARELTSALSETLDLFDVGGTPLTTSEVTDHLDIGRRSTYDRLERLVARDCLETKEVGASARVWWRPSPSTALPTGTDRSGTAVETVLREADVGILLLDSELQVVWSTGAILEYFGLEDVPILGRDKRTLTEAAFASKVEDPTSFTETVLGAYEDGTNIEGLQCHVLPGEGREERWLDYHSERIDSGPYSGGRIEICYDSARTDRRDNHERSQFDSLIDAVEEYAIFGLDEQGAVQSWNDGAERIKGYESDEILGEDFEQFYVSEARETGVPADNLSKAAQQGEFETEGWRVRKDGSRFWASVTITPTYDGDGELQGFTKVTRDMTERRERERELRRERDLIEEMLEIAPIRFATFEPDGSLERMNSRSRQALGFEESGRGEFSLSDLEFYREDGTPLATENHPVPTVIESGEPVTGQIVRHEDTAGATRWVSLNASPVFEGGDLERVVVTGDDITELKRNQRALERQRDELDRELDEMFERVDEAFFSVDNEWRFTYVNDRAASLLDRPAGKLIGRRVWDEFSDAVGTTFEQTYRRAVETQESRSLVEHYPPLDTWFEVNVYPSESGLSVYFRDVTERIERERELERYETIVETMGDGVYVIDQDDTLTMVNDAYAEMLGRDPTRLLGTHVSELVDEETAAEAAALESQLRSGTPETARLEAELETTDGDTIVAEATFDLIETDRGTQERVGVVRDVTERKQREQELKRYEAAVETIDDGVYIVDDQSRFVMVNDAQTELTGYSREELLGSHAEMVTFSASVDLAEQTNESLVESGRGAATVETELLTRDGSDLPVEARFAPFELHDGQYGRVGVVRDITDRRERERQLADRVRQQAVSAKLGQQALEDRNLDGVLSAAVNDIADTLGTAYCELLEYDAASETVHRRDAGGERQPIGDPTRGVDEDSLVAETLQSDDPVVVDGSEEGAALERRAAVGADVESGIWTVVGSSEAPWGVLSVQADSAREFTEQDVTFLQTVGTIVSTAIARRETEEQLARQRDLLAAMNTLGDVVRETTKAVIEQPTRTKIEAAVCENLAESDSYRRARIRALGPGGDSVRIRATAGPRDEPTDATMADDAPSSVVERAVRSREIQIERRGQTAERAGEPEAVSRAIIPIVHEESVYGVLEVSADRDGAFERRERDVVGQLGEVVGHAIAATQRKQALLSDEVVEIEFAIRDVFETVGVTGDTEGRIRFDHAVQLDDDEFVVYGRATDDAVDSLQSLYEARSGWTELTLRAGDDATNFELHTVDAPILSAVANVGGKFERASVEDSDYQMRVHLSPSTDPRHLIETVRERFPSAELLRRRQLTRSGTMADNIRHTFSNELTERQRTVLEAAYHAGFFETPRDVSGTDLATTLNVSPPTVHQHLRKAERKILHALFGEPVS